VSESIFVPSAQNSISRRGFVAACAAVPLAACARMTYVSATVDGNRFAVNRATVDLTGFALVDAPGLEFPIYVHRQSASEYSAVLTRCMHRGCTVEPSAGRLICPCHGSEYTTVGHILKGPTELPLIRYHVSADADTLFIHDTAERPS
jgi:cytochrome b6-f complex iron-sulfur subunit